MAIIKFTSALKRFYPTLDDTEVEVEKVSQVLEKLETIYPGIQSYLIDEVGALRKHVNIFVDGSLIEDREELSDALTQGSEVFIMQALSGG